MKPLRKAAEVLLWFLLFVLLYVAPFSWALGGLFHQDEGLRHVVEEALGVPLVRFEALRNALAHLVLIALCYAVLARLARFAAQRWGLHPALTRLAYLLLGWMMLVSGNATWFPASNYSVAFGWLGSPWVFAITAAALATTALAWAWARLQAAAPAGWGLAGALGVVAAAGGAFLLTFPEAQGRAAPAGSQRNVILIGIDSLSAALWEREQQHLPHLRALMQHAVRYTQAYTPMGRTFPAWVSVLSGQAPADTGAIFNLRNLEHVKRDDLVTHDLRARGYRTVFAIDERRFNNMDEAFGFDSVIGSKAGALDFVVQPLNDTPLTNVLLQTRLGRWLLPYSRLNVASHANYDAAGFVEEIAAATAGAPRLFLATHFLAGHFPFQSRHARIRHGSPNGFLARHVEALSGVDAQVGQLLAALKRQGHLDNALVVVLSDHGEALGEYEGETTQDGRPFKLTWYGHGTHVLSDHANRIVLATVQFVDGQPVGTPGERDEQVSLLDVRRAIERYVGTGEVAVSAAQPCIPMETGLRLNAMRDYRTLDNGEVVREGQGYYELDAQGRLRLKESRLPELVRTKDVGWRCPDRITYYRASTGRHYTYRIDAADGSLVEVDPDPGDVAEITRYRQRLEATATLAAAIH
ncbi:sulfatase-like hydrolase/transferase [Caldimonas thermodepolymerans]|uniref:Sulfatase-like protein n=1 Tax=Caldimonas thermodepolymerans TaxID=215580 RepID=A0AA46DCF8_9BURK|nr:sulfatase-like hydrolase/transferase [Caldimonas thermodepolymerans]TCP05867.1 sulfatase-like protein [Caldimonas thermodepolymerans]UZG48195.1 sulfatase-like hydrolase/transferase [Caldimonas thermodepolymerans]